jgi:inositol phosphorylceramide synthase catalytic subunit
LAGLAGAWRRLRAYRPHYTAFLPLPFVLIAIVTAVRGTVRWEHVAIALLTIGLACGNSALKRVLVGLYPIALVAILYSGMRLVQNIGVRPDTVHLCDLRALELRLFGIESGGVHMTLQDYFQAHSSLGLDLLCSVPYGTFIFASMGCAVYLYFRDFSAMQRFTWTFLIMNVAGFVTYHLYPAAPPWYFHSHGCTVDLTAHASEGPNLARVDAWLGFAYFNGMYGRSSDVFGAVPSLHAAYALLIVIEGYEKFGWPLRIASIAFFVLMCFAAVYLDHHWVIDVIVGIAYCVGVVVALRFAVRLAKRGLRSGGSPDLQRSDASTTKA